MFQAYGSTHQFSPMGSLVCSKRMVVLISSVPWVHACIWQYTRNRGICCFRGQRAHTRSRLLFKGQRCKYSVIFQLFHFLLSVRTTNQIQCTFNANSLIQFESTSNPPQPCPHYRFAMRIGSLMDCACMHASGLDRCM